MTPGPRRSWSSRSGWWQCAAERAGGIVCWLEAIRALAAARVERRALFLASSGHELGHVGLDAFLHANGPLLGGAHAWIHLGANIGAAPPGREPVGVRLQASDDELDRELPLALSADGAAVASRLPRDQVPAMCRFSAKAIAGSIFPTTGIRARSPPPWWPAMREGSPSTLLALAKG